MCIASFLKRMRARRMQVFDDTTQGCIERNIRRQLGVFSVPCYLNKGYPVDKVQLSNREAFRTSTPSDWWKQHIDHERRSVHRQPANASVPAQPPLSAPTLAQTTQPTSAPIMPQGHLTYAYYPAGVTAGPGGMPCMLYWPCYHAVVPPPT